MAITDLDYDQRAQEPNTKPVAEIQLLDAHAQVTGTSITGTYKFFTNGVLKQIKYLAPNLTSDAVFTITILDKDGATVTTISNIADNAASTPKYLRIAEDSAPLIIAGTSNYYTISISWVTSQTVVANAFEIWGFFLNH